MEHYLDIRILPDPEFAPPMLLNALFAKLHRVLVMQQRRDIGISFPGYEVAGPDENGKRLRSTLGISLRLHGDAAGLDGLMASSWLTGMRDHVVQGDIQPVPALAGHLRVQRKQAKSNPARERARLMRRQNVNEAEAMRRIPDSAGERLDLPFLTLASQSTGQQQFRLFIAQTAVDDEVKGEFNSYGLSQRATVPRF